MNYNSTYERCEAARRMGTGLFIVSIIGFLAAGLALLNQGWFACLLLCLPSLGLFALARLFDLVADTLAVTGRIEENLKTNQTAPTIGVSAAQATES